MFNIVYSCCDMNPKPYTPTRIGGTDSDIDQRGETRLVGR